MGATSRIEWTDATWTPIRARRRDNGKVGVHCEKVSEACKNCYAERLNLRGLPNHGTSLPFTVLSREKVDIFADAEMLLQPIRWKRGRRIFVCSQTDLFADFVSDEMIDRVFAVMALAPQHTFQVLTKRPERMAEYFRNTVANARLANAVLERWVIYGLHNPPPRHPLPNVWLGVTAENQARADERIPVLLQTPAAKRFVSIEPMLGPVDLENLPSISGIGRYLDSLQKHRDGSGVGSLDWVICGGESGPGARPMHPDWVRSMRDQCIDAGVPFFFKQIGEWSWNHADPVSELEGGATEYVNIDGTVGAGWVLESDPETISNYCGAEPKDNCVWIRRVGKARAGRILDGREWNEFPEVACER